MNKMNFKFLKFLRHQYLLVFFVFLIGGCSNNTPKQKAIFFLEEGNNQELSALLQNEPSLINMDYGAGYTLLHLAVMKEVDAKLIRTIILAGANPNAMGGYRSETPLHLAYGYGAHSEIISLLISAGADPQKKNCHGEIPKDYYGAIYGHPPTPNTNEDLSTDSIK